MTNTGADKLHRYFDVAVFEYRADIRQRPSCGPTYAAGWPVRYHGDIRDNQYRYHSAVV